MKKGIIFFIAFGFLMSGCSKELKDVDYGSINPTNFPQTADDIQAMVNACYYPLRGSWWDGINTTSERGLMMMKDCQTGILRGFFDEAEASTTMNYTPLTTGITFFYDWYHGNIGMMSLYLDEVENTDIALTDEARKKAIGEIRMARGLLAYDLYTLYGPIVIPPLEILKNPLQEAPLARLSHDDMIQFLEDDFKAAAEDLPAPSETEYGRFSSALARTLLIKLYLNEKRWQDALDEANSVINDNFYSIDPNYVGMWGLNGAKASPEVIWAIPCDYDGTSENQWQMMALPGNYPGFPGFAAIQSSWWFYDSFEKNDVRKTRLIAEYTGTDGVRYDRDNPGLFLNYGPLPLKIDPDANRSTEISTVDIIQYRYADILLSKAEAIANINNGPTQECMDLVNEIRGRAGLNDLKLADYNTLSSFIDMLLMERAHEFWCENGDYRDDLIRYGKLLDRVELIAGDQYVADYKILWPFSRQNVNEGKGKFVQNPHYN